MSDQVSGLLLNKPVLLEQNQAHVWCADLELPAAVIDELFVLLNEDEKRRADRFYFVQDRTRFIAARGILRKVLGRYIGLAPEQLRFAYNNFGKPDLVQQPDLQFNLSHAHNKALIAVAWKTVVGVDIEYCVRELDMDGIAQRFFSARENQIIQALTDVKKQQAFFTGWVRKEAFLKAIGMGLSYSLDKVEVTLLPEQPAKIIALHDEAQNIEDWSLFALPVAEDYKAALAVKGRHCTLKTWQYVI